MNIYCCKPEINPVNTRGSLDVVSIFTECYGRQMDVETTLSVCVNFSSYDNSSFVETA